MKLDIKFQLDRAFNSENKEIAVGVSNLASAEFFEVELCIYCPISKSSTDAERNGKLWGSRKHGCKPDLDNVEKFYLDCLTGIVFADDSKVFKLSSIKKYSLNPRVEIVVKGHRNNLSDQVVGIVETFGPDRLIEFLTASYELFDLFGRDDEGDWVLDAVGAENASEVKLARTAYLLSTLAEISHKPFQKIHRQFPDFHKKAEKVADSIKSA